MAKESFHGRYRLLSIPGKLGGVKARALLGSKQIADAEAGSTQEAFATLRCELDRLDKERVAARQQGVPSADEYAEAILHLKSLRKVSRLQARLLLSLFDAPGMTAAATEIARGAGQADFSVANLHLGMFGRDVAKDLAMPLPERNDGSHVGTRAFATGEADSKIPFQWTLRPQVAEALAGGVASVLKAI